MNIWNRDWFPLPGEAVFDRNKQQIAAVSRAPGNLDLFVIGFDNHVWSTFWNDAGGWSRDWFRLPGQHVFDHEKQQLAAVSRAPGNLDLFVIGFDNHVYSTFWNDRTGWNADFFPLPGQHVFDREKQQLAAVSRAPGNLDLFVIGFDNHVYSTFWNDRTGWSADFFPLPGQHVFDREKQQLAAVSRAPGNLDIFVIGFDNHVYSTFWNDRTGWNADFFPLPGQHVFDRDKQQLAAVSRAPGNLDIFVIGFDNHVYSTFWNDRTGWSADFFPLPGQHVFDRDKQQLAAVSRAPGNLDIFVIGFDNHVYCTFWNDRTGWNADFFPLPGRHVFDREKQQLAAVSRAPGNLDLFVIGFDNRVYSTFWGPILDHFTFDDDISAANRMRLIECHRDGLFSVGRCGNLNEGEKQRLRENYARAIHHTTLNEPGVNASATVGGSRLNVNFGVLFPQGDEEIAQTLIHEMMHCAGFSHPARRDPPAGSSCAAPNPAVFDCPNDNGVYYGTAPLRAEFCIAGDQSDVRSRLARKAAQESCTIDEQGVARIRTR